MAVANPTAYTAAAGAKIRGGRAVALPSWVPPAGFFADVPMLNNAADVAPSLYGAAGVEGAFIQFGGSAWVSDFSTLGAQVYHSGGHENSAGQVHVQLAAVCDFSSRLWTISNVPTAANLATGFDPSTNLYPDGTAYNPHSYNGLQELPAAWGGASRGSLAQFFWAGGEGIKDRVHFLDIAAATNGYSMLNTNQPQNSQPTLISFSANGGKSGGNAPLTVTDYSRQGWWASTDGTVDYLLFISKTGTITQYTAPGGNSLYAAMFLVPSLNILCIHDGGYTAADANAVGANSTVHKAMYIRDLSDNSTVTVLNNGPVPAVRDGFAGPPYKINAPRQIGLQWVEELGAAFGLDDTTDQANPVVVKLMPPLTNPKTTAWTWSTVPVSHWATGDVSGSASLRGSSNTVCSMFRWIPTLHAFVYCVGSNVKPQVIRI